jgi:hypothetical protein
MRTNLFWLSDEQWKRLEPHLPEYYSLLLENSLYIAYWRRRLSPRWTGYSARTPKALCPQRAIGSNLSFNLFGRPISRSRRATTPAHGTRAEISATMHLAMRQKWPYSRRSCPPHGPAIIYLAAR